MALGFGFNKTKVLASAEKYVQQGKLKNAIEEYLKVAKEDPKDLTVLNTIGDLHARLGQNEPAANYFKKVGDSYASGGFTVKAIAMYKKITKLNPAALDFTLKLAELYTQQGLYNDARAQYMQVAENAMRTGDLQGASRIFQKMLELDPENAAMQTKLADLYVRTGKKEDARNIFFSAAQSLYMRGALDGADEALGKVLNLDPANAPALILRGQVALDSGNAQAAAQYLEQIADLDSRPDALKILLRARILLGAASDGEAIARKLLTVHNDPSGVSAYAEGLMAAGDCEAALRVYEQFADRLLATNPAAVVQQLNDSIARVKDNPRALEIVLSLFRRAGDTSHAGEVMELLAHASVQSGDLAKARELYRELALLEPENELHARNYRQVVAKMGDDITSKLGGSQGSQALMMDTLESGAPAVDQKYDEALTEAVKAALTDSELLESYNLPVKAIEPLEKVLPRAPHDVKINHRLAALYARCERFADAAARCAVLRAVLAEAGHHTEAKQYAEMAASYQQRAGGAAPAFDVAAAEPAMSEAASPALAEPASAAVTEFSMEVAIPAAEPATAAPAAAPAAAMDLSDEWESMTVVDADAPAAAPPPPAAEPVAAPGPSIGDLIEETRFYITQGMMAEARTALAHCTELAPGDERVAALRQQLEATAAPASEFEVAAPSVEAAPVATPPAPAPTPAPMPAAPPPAAHDALGDLALGLEESLGDDFSIAKPPAKVPAPPKPAAAVAAAQAPAAAPAVSAPAPAAASLSAEANELSDIFEEFKEGVEEATPEDADPQTHYNLGVAFKEMGLLDEAIGELQKVAHAIDHGVQFSDGMQACTLLASCFLEKGVPQAAVKWYEKALKSPGLDDDSLLAIQYELAAAHEAGGDRQKALQHFMTVYSSNIDYRDVAERIKALKA